MEVTSDGRQKYRTQPPAQLLATHLIRSDLPSSIEQRLITPAPTLLMPTPLCLPYCRRLVHRAHLPLLPPSLCPSLSCVASGPVGQRSTTLLPLSACCRAHWCCTCLGGRPANAELHGSRAPHQPPHHGSSLVGGAVPYVCPLSSECGQSLPSSPYGVAAEVSCVLLALIPPIMELARPVGHGGRRTRTLHGRCSWTSPRHPQPWRSSSRKIAPPGREAAHRARRSSSAFSRRGPNLNLVPIPVLGVSSVHFPCCNFCTRVFHRDIDVATVFSSATSHVATSLFQCFIITVHNSSPMMETGSLIPAVAVGRRSRGRGIQEDTTTTE
jgi:hypothetical protein